MRDSLCESQVTISVQLLPDWVIPTSAFWYMGVAVPPNLLWVHVRVHMYSRSRLALRNTATLECSWQQVAGKGEGEWEKVPDDGRSVFGGRRSPRNSFLPFLLLPQMINHNKVCILLGIQSQVWKKMGRAEMYIDLAGRHRQQPSLWDCPWPKSLPSMQSAASRWLLVTDIKELNKNLPPNNDTAQSRNSQDISL